MEKLSNMQRVKEVNREETLNKIINNCKALLNNKNFLLNNDWETDTLLLQAESNLKREILNIKQTDLNKDENIT